MGEEDKADKGRGGKTTSGNREAWSSPVPEGSGEQRKKMEETGCEVICGAPTTPAVKGQVKEGEGESIKNNTMCTLKNACREMWRETKQKTER